MKPSSRQEQLYAEAAARFGPALQRIAHATEADHDRQRDLVQDIHLELWRSLALFDGRSSLSTWVWRVAHNTAANHVVSAKRRNVPLVSLDDATPMNDPSDIVADFEAQETSQRLTALIRQLALPDRQIITLYLEGVSAAEIGLIIGMEPATIASRISRFKSRAARQFKEKTHD